MNTMKEGEAKKKVWNRKDTILDYFDPMSHFKWNEAEEGLLIKSTAVSNYGENHKIRFEVAVQPRAW
jgi:hypothetical protein